MNPDDTLTLTLTVDRERLRGELARAEVENLVYKLAAAIFEFGGEYNRHPDGSQACACHGHHAAQRLAEAAGKEWARGAKGGAR